MLKLLLWGLGGTLLGLLVFRVAIYLWLRHEAAKVRRRVDAWYEAQERRLHNTCVWYDPLEKRWKS